MKGSAIQKTNTSNLAYAYVILPDLNSPTGYSSFMLNLNAVFALFVLASNYTAEDVLSKLLTVDGNGSNLDADLLDGNHASAFAVSNHNHDSAYSASNHNHDSAYAAKLKPRRAVTSASALVASDNTGIVEMNSSSAFNFTINQMSDGFQCDLININTGAITLVAGSGVTLRYENASRKLSTQYKGVSIYFRSATECVIVGSLIA